MWKHWHSTKNLCKIKWCVSDTQADHSVRALYTLLVLSCGVSSGSLLFSISIFFGHTTKTVTSWVDAQTAQMVSFEIQLLFRFCNYSKRHAYNMPKSTKNVAKSKVQIQILHNKTSLRVCIFVIIEHLNDI